MSTAAAPAASPGQAFGLTRLGDERLAARVTDGDVSAFAAIYERYHQQLFRYCRSILRDDGDAQDALQSAFERAFSALQRGQRSAPLRPWLYRIAHNEAITVIRRRGSEEVSEDLDPGVGPSAEHTAAERARLAILLDDLADLPERPRGALVMRELGDLSHEEIALALSISVGAAKQAIFEARRGLQECVEGRAMACDDIQRRISDGDRRALRGRRMRAHMRDCAACGAFAASIEERRSELRALTPVLAPAAAAAIFARAAGTMHAGGAGAAGGGGLGAGAALGKAGVTTALVSSKLPIVAAVVATAAAGAGGVVAVAHLSAGPAHRAAHVKSNSSLARPHSDSPATRASSVTSAGATLTGARAGAAPAAAAVRHTKSHPRGQSGAHRSASAPASHGGATLVSHGAASGSHAGGNPATGHAYGNSTAGQSRGNSTAGHGRGNSTAAHARGNSKGGLAGSRGRSTQAHARSGSGLAGIAHRHTTPKVSAPPAKRGMPAAQTARSHRS